MCSEAIRMADSKLTLGNRWDHALARLGVRRSEHRVEPGLYRMGSPGPDAPVLVTANYTLSFDALRSSLKEVDAHILVLDTKGVNVWCAAGKGTFGTEEIVRQVEETGLGEIVTHRRLILPQLGAPGVSAQEVKRRTGFQVEYGPVRASDLDEYLETGAATEEMRTVRFGFGARTALIFVEAVHILLPVLAVSIVLRLLGAVSHLYNEAIAGVTAGIILGPLCLPWIPTKDFSSKGYLIGMVAAAPIVVRELTVSMASWWRSAGTSVGVVLIVASIAAFLLLNFTGSSTYTSRTGVKREIFRYVPIMAWTFGAGVVLRILFLVL